MNSNCRVCDESLIPPPHDCANVDPTGVIADLRAQLNEAHKLRQENLDAQVELECAHITEMTALAVECNKLKALVEKAKGIANKLNIAESDSFLSACDSYEREYKC